MRDSYTTTVLTCLLSACAGASEPPALERPPLALRDGDVDRGARLARHLCVACHGERGDGRGPYAGGLDPKPRDFTRAVFRYRSTPSGSLPVDADLARTTLVGLPGTSMPSYADFLGAQDLRDLVAWVKSFSPRFQEEEIDEPIEVPPPPAMTKETIARGREVYVEMQCGKCHGDDGSGDGWASADEMRDDQGRIAQARDFTVGIYRSGRRQEDLYRTFLTGLDGSPMPAYEDAVPPEDIYALVHYLLDLEQDRGILYWLFNPPRWHEPSDYVVDRGWKD